MSNEATSQEKYVENLKTMLSQKEWANLQWFVNAKGFMWESYKTVISTSIKEYIQNDQTKFDEIYTLYADMNKEYVAGKDTMDEQKKSDYINVLSFMMQALYIASPTCYVNAKVKNYLIKRAEYEDGDGSYYTDDAENIWGKVSYHVYNSDLVKKVEANTADLRDILYLDDTEKAMITQVIGADIIASSQVYKDLIAERKANIQKMADTETSEDVYAFGIWEIIADAEEGGNTRLLENFEAIYRETYDINDEVNITIDQLLAENTIEDMKTWIIEDSLFTYTETEYTTILDAWKTDLETKKETLLKEKFFELKVDTANTLETVTSAPNSLVPGITSEQFANAMTELIVGYATSTTDESGNSTPSEVAGMGVWNWDDAELLKKKDFMTALTDSENPIEWAKWLQQLIYDNLPEEQKTLFIEKNAKDRVTAGERDGKIGKFSTKRLSFILGWTDNKYFNEQDNLTKIKELPSLSSLTKLPPEDFYNTDGELVTEKVDQFKKIYKNRNLNLEKVMSIDEKFQPVMIELLTGHRGLVSLGMEEVAPYINALATNIGPMTIGSTKITEAEMITMLWSQTITDISFTGVSTLTEAIIWACVSRKYEGKIWFDKVTALGAGEWGKINEIANPSYVSLLWLTSLDGIPENFDSYLAVVVNAEVLNALNTPTIQYIQYGKKLTKAVSSEITVDGVAKNVIEYGDYQYEWPIVNGKPEGEGVLYDTTEDGAVIVVYTWSFKDGKKDGQGKYTWANGDIYEGEWKNDKRTWQGKCTWANGDIYEGEWKNNKRTWQGKYTWANGGIYEGAWKNNNMEWEGTYTNAAGIVFTGKWEGQTLVEETSSDPSKTFNPGKTRTDLNAITDKATLA